MTIPAEFMDLTEIIHFDNTQRHPWELARYRVVKEHISSLIAPIDKDQLTILDIGCGDAYLVHKLSEDFPNLYFIGVDINFTESLLDHTRRNIRTDNLQIYQSLDDIDLERQVDLILLLDVIEHIEDEITFLKSLKRYDYISTVTPLLITVPAYQQLFASHDVILEHYRRYSNKSLRNRLSAAGYITSYERYFFLSLIPPRILQLITEKIFKPRPKKSSDLAAWKGGNTITKLVETLLVLDYKIGSLLKRMGIKLPGLSNLVVCHRSV